MVKFRSVNDTLEINATPHILATVLSRFLSRLTTNIGNYPDLLSTESNTGINRTLHIHFKLVHNKEPFLAITCFYRLLQSKRVMKFKREVTVCISCLKDCKSFLPWTIKLINDVAFPT